MTHAALRVGVVGCGVIGARRAAVAASDPRCRVVLVADDDAVRVSAVAEQTGASPVADWGKVVGHPEVDVVIVATRHDWLSPVSVAAIKAGKHVLCEKPMSRNRREAEDVAAAARNSGCVVKVGFNHRYHPAIQRAHQLAGAGRIGMPLFARCRYGHGGRPGYEREWRMDPTLSGGGELLDQGVHVIDLFRWFFGDLEVVAGVTAAWVWDAPVEDNVFALFRTRRGQVASLHASWTQWRNLFSLEVYGDQGALLIEGLGKNYGTESLTIYTRDNQGGPPTEERHEFPGPDSSWKSEWDDFIGTIRTGTTPMANAEDGLAALRLVEAVYEHAARIRSPSEDNAR
jgi:predicted dehydrogenase